MENRKRNRRESDFHNQILLANVNFTAWCYIHSAGIAESVFETSRRSLINIYFVLDIKRPTHIERAPSIVGRESDFRSLNVKNTQSQKTRHFLEHHNKLQVIFVFEQFRRQF